MTEQELSLSRRFLCLSGLHKYIKAIRPGLITYVRLDSVRNRFRANPNRRTATQTTPDSAPVATIGPEATNELHRKRVITTEDIELVFKEDVLKTIGGCVPAVETLIQCN